MKYEVIFTPIDEKNLAKIKKWLNKITPLRALKWVDGLILQINSLDETPLRFPNGFKNIAKRCPVYDL